MIRSISIFAFFALATVLVIVLQPGPRPDYAYDQPDQILHETSRNNVQVLPEPTVVPILTAPDETIANLKKAAEPARAVVEPTAPARSLQRLQAALDASLGNETMSSDARQVVAVEPAKPSFTEQLQPAAQAVAPELRDMSWQTLNALNGLGRVAKAPGQEGSLLNSIVRRSMGHVGSAPNTLPRVMAPETATVESVPAKAVLSTQGSVGSDQNYIVSSGDTLALIAIKLYGSALATDNLLRDNPALRQNPNALRIGQVLKYRMQ